LAVLSLVAGLAVGRAQGASECDDPPPAWLACEDFEGGAAGWQAWFPVSPFVECLGCRQDGTNNPDRILLDGDAERAHSGEWSLHMPASASSGYQGASLTFRSCEGPKRPGCRLTGYEELYFRTWVKLAADHEEVHHFLEIAGTRPNGYWESDGNAGCRPNGTRWAGTTLDFNARRELHFYTYFPEMRCDAGNYCSGDTVRNICAQCAAKDMPCSRMECCWGNHFGPETPVVLPRGEWVCLEIGMRLNTPGEDDGWMAFWVNGELAHRQEAMHWRDTADLKLNKAWLQHYLAQGDADQSNRVWFDDVVVSTARIGCGGDVAPTPTGPRPTATATESSTPAPPTVEPPTGQPPTGQPSTVQPPTAEPPTDEPTSRTFMPELLAP
jgi:hypothetical protein